MYSVMEKGLKKAILARLWKVKVIVIKKVLKTWKVMENKTKNLNLRNKKKMTKMIPMIWRMNKKNMMMR